jgi:hypothetical protein
MNNYYQTAFMGKTLADAFTHSLYAAIATIHRILNFSTLSYSTDNVPSTANINLLHYATRQLYNFRFENHLDTIITLSLIKIECIQNESGSKCKLV